MKPLDESSLAAIGENLSVARFRKLASAFPNDKVIVGAGDDAAAICIGQDHLLLLTCDMIVEEVHFRLDWSNPWQVGWKAMAQNLSDIAAMGGEPGFAVASIAAPGKIKQDVAEGITQGLIAAASGWDACLVGGDLVGSPGPLVVDVAVTGWVREQEMLRRKGAHPGDAILVTGSLGASAAGLEALRSGMMHDGGVALERALKAHLQPKPRIVEAQAIAEIRRATAMMDLSDGLAEDLPRLCAESAVGARIFVHHLPIDPACLNLAERLSKDPLQLAISGGEDYELLFTSPPDTVGEIMNAVKNKTGTSVTMIGEITEKDISFVDSKGLPIEVHPGFDHFNG